MAPRRSNVHSQTLPAQILVVDNGAYSIKAGFATDSPNLEECHIIPNCLARERDRKVWVGNEVDACRDFGEMAFRRPVEKGYVVNWESEKAIWDSSFRDPKSKLHHLFGAPVRETQGLPNPAECLLVIDSGFSHSTVTPLYKGRPIQQAVRRLDIGGKLLTNYLKELLSIRHYNLMNEEHLVNEAKEKVCFVSSDFRNDLERAWKGSNKNSERNSEHNREIVVDYVLPDYNAGTKGHLRSHDPSLAARVKKMGAMANQSGAVEDFMTLGNERFAVPEVLFSPADLGMKEAGLPETVMQSLSGLPPGLWPAMLANVLVIGGDCLMDGFMERLPIKSIWLGGAILAADRTALKAMQVTRQEYLEHGSGWVSRIFAGTATK
ncbi:MAG: hypothetical protein Q9220_001111 [cf. Caloplaca sp. 1 TL-2023]